MANQLTLLETREKRRHGFARHTHAFADRLVDVGNSRRSSHPQYAENGEVEIGEIFVVGHRLYEATGGATWQDP